MCFDGAVICFKSPSAVALIGKLLKLRWSRLDVHTTLFKLRRCCAVCVYLFNFIYELCIFRWLLCFIAYLAQLRFGKWKSLYDDNVYDLPDRTSNKQHAVCCPPDCCLLVMMASNILKHMQQLSSVWTLINCISVRHFMFPKKQQKKKNISHKSSKENINSTLITTINWNYVSLLFISYFVFGLVAVAFSGQFGSRKLTFGIVPVYMLNGFVGQRAL